MKPSPSINETRKNPIFKSTILVMSTFWMNERHVHAGTFFCSTLTVCLPIFIYRKPNICVRDARNGALMTTFKWAAHLAFLSIHRPRIFHSIQPQHSPETNSYKFDFSSREVLPFERIEMKSNQEENKSTGLRPRTFFFFLFVPRFSVFVVKQKRIAKTPRNSSNFQKFDFKIKQ